MADEPAATALRRRLGGELAELVDLPGGVGAEDPVSAWIAGRLRDRSRAVTRDRLGNLLLMAPGARPQILVTAHMDQVGYMVSRVERDRAHCLSVGTPGGDGLSHPVRVVGATHPDLAGAIQAEDDGTGVLFCADQGRIRVGDRVTFAEPLSAIDDERVRGPALDNRVGCLVMLEAARIGASGGADPLAEVAFAWTVREETDQAGALRVARRIEPEIVVVVDATYASDGARESDSLVGLGRGPVITLLDEGMVCHRPLVESFAAAADTRGISWQPEVVSEGISEAGRVQGELGIPALPLLVAIENAHTDHEVAHLGDLAAAIELLVGGLKEAAARLDDESER